MSIITKSQLYGFRNSTRTYTKTINESLKEFSSESKSGKVTIFLSHKHEESQELDSAISFLKRFGVNVYVDWMDSEMPTNTSGETAKRIKTKIKENRKFVFLATEAAIGSKWCNWELGYGDAQKYIEHIAILPIKNDFGNFSGSEYLQIYPTIEKVDSYSVSRSIGGYFDSGYYVVTQNENNKAYIKLEEWLTK